MDNIIDIEREEHRSAARFAHDEEPDVDYDTSTPGEGTLQEAIDALTEVVNEHKRRMGR